MLRIVFISFLINSIVINSFSQNSDTTNCNWGTASIAENVSVYIKDKKGINEIKWKFFYKKFELELSDPSYKIVSFQMTWDVKRKDMLVSRIIIGSLVSVEIEDQNIKNKTNYSLLTIEPGSLVTFDNILVEKNGICYKAKPFIIYSVLK